jgi:Cu/Ag efflux pump CusA
MAVAVVGGVALSTLLTLFVVPCAYEVFSKLERQPQHIDEKEKEK